MIVTPTLFVKLMLANGIIFDNEDLDPQSLMTLSKNILERITFNLEVLVKELILFRDKRPSHLASAVVYLSRKEEFVLINENSPPEAWTAELQNMTTYSELDLIELADKIKVQSEIHREKAALA